MPPYTRVPQYFYHASNASNVYSNPAMAHLSNPRICLGNGEERDKLNVVYPSLAQTVTVGRLEIVAATWVPGVSGPSTRTPGPTDRRVFFDEYAQISKLNPHLTPSRNYFEI